MAVRQAWLIVLLLFVISVLLRIPNLNRPLSKHHEFNSAVILLNIDSWRQAGGGARFHYVPLLNYQHPGDKSNSKLPYNDADGNAMYLSFGPGWYVIPYFFYELFHWPVHPVYLQVINLFFELAALIMFFLLCERLTGAPGGRRYEPIVVACSCFLFAPGILWYLGNGYVNTGIMLPFLCGLLLLLIPMLENSSNVGFGRLMAAAGLIAVIVYIDWFVIFLAGVFGLWFLFRVRREPRYWWLIVAIGFGCVVGLALILLQLASYAGLTNVLLCWQNRAMDRSLAHTSDPVYLMAMVVLRHVMTCYFPVLALAGWGLWRGRTRWNAVEKKLWGCFAAAVVLYNFILLDWSFEHEFALVPLSLLLAYSAGRCSMSWAGRRGWVGVVGVFMILSMAQYYLINRPGKISRDGTPFDAYQKLGEAIHASVPDDHRLFMDKEWSAVIDFYANRNILPMDNIDSARVYIKREHIAKAIWIDHEHFKLKKLVILNQADQ